MIRLFGGKDDKAKNLHAVRKRIYETMCGFDKVLVPLKHRPLAKVLRHELARWLVDTDAKMWVPRKGRRIGFSTVVCPRLFAAWIMVVAALLNLPPGEVVVLGLISVKRGESGNRIGNITAVFDAVGIKYDLRGDDIILKDFPIIVRVLTRNWRLVVGETIGCLWCDEVSRWESDDDSANPAKEVITTLIPSTATIAESLIVIGSSVWSEVDFHAETYDKGDTAFQVTSHIPTWFVNPDLTEQACRDLSQGDDHVFNREWAAIPAGTISGALPSDHVKRSFGKIRTSLGRGSGGFAAIDPSSLRSDRFAFCYGYESEGIVTIDEVGAFTQEDFRKCTMADIVKAIADKAKGRGISTIFSDQREAAGLTSLFSMCGVSLVTFDWSERSKETAFVLLQRLLADGLMRIVEHKELRAEMLSCKAILTPSGHVRYATNGLDYLSTVITLMHARQYSFSLIGGESKLARRIREAVARGEMFPPDTSGLGYQEGTPNPNQRMWEVE